MSFVGCKKIQPQNAETTTSKAENVMKAWSGAFSKEKFKSAINEYQNNYSAVALQKGDKSSVSFITDFDMSSCTVTSLSRVDNNDIEFELQSSINHYVESNCNGRTITIPVDWWYTGDDSRVKDHFVWSYLVRVKDTEGSNHYYYFRVDYSAYAE